MPNPNPNRQGLIKLELPPNFKSAPLRVRVHKDAYDAFAALTPEERGKVVQAWYDNHK